MKKRPGVCGAAPKHHTSQQAPPQVCTKSARISRLRNAASVLCLILVLAACQGRTPTPGPVVDTPGITPAPGVALVLPSPTAPATPAYSVPIPLEPAPTPGTVLPEMTVAANGTPGTVAAARVPFSINQGDISGLAWPQPDQVNLQSLRFLVSDGRTFLHNVTRDTDVRIEPPDATRATWRITYTDREGRYRLVEDISSAAGSDAVIVRTALETETGSALDYQVYLVIEPGLAGTADGDTINVNVSEAVALLSDRQPANGLPTFMAIATDTPWVTASAGYLGANDGLSDLQDLRLDQAYESAGPGANPTLTVWLVPAGQWTTALGLGSDADRARTAVVDALAEAYADDQ